MKKHWLCLLLALCLLPVWAFGESLEKWNESCDYRALEALNVYHEAEDAAKGVSPMAVLPAGTYVRLNAEADGWLYVDYYLDGRIGTGAVEKSGLTCLNPTPTPPDPTPTPTPIPTPTATPIPTPTPTPKPTPTPLPPEKRYPISLRTSGEEATVVALGSYTCVVDVDGEEREVPSSELMISDEVPSSEQLAMIYAPRTGKVTLRASASSKGKSLGSCAAGTIVGVVRQGSTFTRVLHNGTEKFVLTSCLQYDVVQTHILGYGDITLPDGQAELPVRTQTDADSAQTTAWPNGTRVMVLRRVDDWFEAELNGLRGFVPESAVTLVENDAETLDE